MLRLYAAPTFTDAHLTRFAGPGVYTDNGRLPSWYNGRGFVEFGAYSSWFIGGVYFLLKASLKPKGGGELL